jgi:DNA-binding MarR family transcriptional regulator
MSGQRPPIPVSELQAGITAFVREFGLLQPDRTPCGRPIATSEAHALAELERDGPLSQHELGSRLRLEKSTVSRLVAHLEGRGWVARSRGGSDGRVVWLELTDAGSSVAEELAAAREIRFAEILSRIPPERQVVVTEGLGVLVGAIRDRKPGG